MVFIQEDNVKHGQWSLVRLVGVNPGGDGVAWVVTIQISKGTYKFPEDDDEKFEVPHGGGNFR